VFKPAEGRVQVRCVDHGRVAIAEPKKPWARPVIAGRGLATAETILPIHGTTGLLERAHDLLFESPRKHLPKLEAGPEEANLDGGAGKIQDLRGLLN
jgi:hypothetical protein